MAVSKIEEIRFFYCSEELPLSITFFAFIYFSLLFCILLFSIKLFQLHTLCRGDCHCSLIVTVFTSVRDTGTHPPPLIPTLYVGRHDTAHHTTDTRSLWVEWCLFYFPAKC